MLQWLDEGEIKYMFKKRRDKIYLKLFYMLIRK